MLAAAVLAAACAAWHPQAAGHYLGVVQSRGEKAVDAWIEAGPDGRLKGRYVLHEDKRDVAGTLEGLGDAGCDAALFRWTDVYGTGVARLRFHLERRCFVGAWGTEAVNEAYELRSCKRSRLTS